IESFKSTLDEIREADLLLHVVDISHPAFEDQISVVNKTLSDIGAIDKPMIMVFNKIDLYREQHDGEGYSKDNIDQSQKPGLEDLKKMFMSKGDHKAVFISAENKENIEELRAAIHDEVEQKHFTIFPNYLKSDY